MPQSLARRSEEGAEKGDGHMSASLIGFLIAVVVTVLLVLPLSKSLRKHPAVYYVIGLVLTAVYVWATWTNVNTTRIRALMVILQKGYLSSLLLGVVMFTGCFDDTSAVRKRLQPIRGELSILSFIFIIGHLCVYLPNYLTRFTQVISTRANVAVSVIIALVLTVLFAVLTVTSFRFVHRRMSTSGWKNLQRLSYVMVVLYALHVLLVLGRSAIVRPNSLAMVNLVLYMAIVIVYTVMRIRKALRDRKRRAECVKA
jgi:sulfoxide reductase heme-binding subunit YedZ